MNKIVVIEFKNDVYFNNCGETHKKGIIVFKKVIESLLGVKIKNISDYKALRE